MKRAASAIVSSFRISAGGLYRISVGPESSRTSPTSLAELTLASCTPPCRFKVVDTSSYQYSGQVDNIDERDMDDPLCATEYVEDMYSVFREKEYSTSVRPDFMDEQPLIDPRMRSTLVDWLIEVHWKFHLVPDTLYLTINLIDRYISLTKKSIPKLKLQLVGVTCLLIASKQEEISPPLLSDLAYACGNSYTRLQVSTDLF